MMNYCGDSLVKWFLLSLLVSQVFTFPKAIPDENPIKEKFSESKRDTSSLAMGTIYPILKAPLFNPYFIYPPFIPGKPFYSPPMSPSDILLNRLAKATSATTSPSSKPPFDAVNPSYTSAEFKAKREEFLTKLFAKLINDTVSSGLSARSAPMPEDSDPTKAPIDSSYFLQKKYEFLETLFKTLNATAQPNATDAQEVNTVDTTTVTTPKPTIVPADFWFPFAKLPKPTKAPKPTKPPKFKKILKDAMDNILMESLLLDLGVDPKVGGISKRSVEQVDLSKPEEESTESPVTSTEEPFLTPAEILECFGLFFHIFNRTYDKELESDEEPETTVIPTNLWTEPNETENTSKPDTFSDLIESLNATESEESGETEKSFEGTPGKKISKRSTFLDELLHRVTTTPPPATTSEPTLPPEDISILDDPDYDGKKACCCDEKCLGSVDGSGKSSRSLIFKPFGSGYWIPQYLYAAKMGMYLDKLMDTINTAAANEVESESANTDGLKRSLLADDADTSGMPSKDAALTLIIAELTNLKNDIVDAFDEAVKAQKDATPTPKAYTPVSKSFKKPFWGSKMLPTTDPIAPIQKRIDILNGVFDKLTKVEKTLIFAEEPEYDPKLIANLTEILQASSPKSKSNAKISSKQTAKTGSIDPDSSEYYLTKTREYLKSLYSSKTDESDD